MNIARNLWEHVLSDLIMADKNESMIVNAPALFPGLRAILLRIRVLISDSKAVSEPKLIPINYKQN